MHYAYSRDTWRLFLCWRHAAQVSGAEPLTSEHRAELKERRRQFGRAMRGEPYRRPRPIVR